MSSYSPIVNYQAKDGLSSGDPLKRIKGTEITAELNAISTAIASKADLASPVFTGTPSAPTAAVGTNTTQLATTAFTQTAISNLSLAAVAANGWYSPGANRIAAATNSAKALEVNADGNVTIGNGTIPAWNTTVFNALMMGNAGKSGIVGRRDTSEQIWMVSNVYFDAGSAFRYIGSAAGSYYQQIAGAHTFATFPVGVAGNTGTASNRMTIANSGNVTIGTPDAGTTSLTVNAVSGQTALSMTDGTAGLAVDMLGASGWRINGTTNHAGEIRTNATARMTFAAAGNVGVNAPSSGTALTVTGNGGSTTSLFSSTGAGTNTVTVNATNGIADFTVNSSGTNSAQMRLFTQAGSNERGRLQATDAGNLFLSTNGASNADLNINSSGVVTVDSDRSGTGREVGWREAIQNTQDTNYTLVIGDRGKHINHTSASAHTWTIPANGTVAFPIGTMLTFVNQSGGGNVSIAITTDTLRQAGTTNTGTRTLAANGVATAIKVAATVWYISGSGLT